MRMHFESWTEFSGFLTSDLILHVILEWDVHTVVIFRAPLGAIKNFFSGFELTMIQGNSRKKPIHSRKLGQYLSVFQLLSKETVFVLFE